MSEKMAEKTYNNQEEKINVSDRNYQNAINEKEQQYEFTVIYYFFTIHVYILNNTIQVYERRKQKKRVSRKKNKRIK